MQFECSEGAASQALPRRYRRRQPEKTALYRLVSEHLETLLEDARTRTSHGFGYPRHVERAFEEYLDCGVLEAGFCRVRCASCGFERLVAFSCKRRGICPSCQARRTADTAAHLVDRVLPAVPYRQWVFTLPIALRLRLAREPALLSRVLRLFIRRVFAYLRCEARKMGIADGRCASVTFVHRFGSAINVNLHFQALIADGVFDLCLDGSVRFVPVLSPTDDDVARLCAQLAGRVGRLVERELDERCADDDPDAPAVDQSFAFGPRLPPARRDDSWEHPRARGRRNAFVDGFSLHANVDVGATDRKGLERLCRYGLRSAFALERLSIRDDGKVVYRLKRPGPAGPAHRSATWSRQATLERAGGPRGRCWPTPGGKTQLVLDPITFLRRLAWLIPPPRSHLVRYHGAFAANSALRAKILPRHERRRDAAACGRERGLGLQKHVKSEREPMHPTEPSLSPPAAIDPRPEDAPPMLLGPPPTPDDLLPLRDRYLDWAELLRRVYAEDVLACPRCNGRLRVLAAISQPDVVAAILAHLGIETSLPPRAPPRCSLSD